MNVAPLDGPTSGMLHRLSTEARMAELERAGWALQQMVDALAALESLQAFIPRALQIVAEAFGTTSAGYFEHPTETIYLRYWLLGNRVYGPEELPGLDESRYSLMVRMAGGFTVPKDHLGVEMRKRKRPSILHHRAAQASPELHAFCISMGWDWELNVPLMVNGSPDGAITLFRSEDKPFTEADFSLAESLAKQIALAMQTSKIAERERAISIASERERAAQLRAEDLAQANELLRRGADHLVESGDILQFLNLSLSEATRLTGASAGGIFIRTGQGTEMKLMAHWPELSPEAHAALSEKMAAVTMQDREGVYAKTLAGDFITVNPQDERLARVFPEAVQYHRSKGHQVAWHLRLRAGGRSIGFMGLAFQTAPSSGYIRESLKALIQQIALALELTRLGDDARHLAVTREKRRAAEERSAELARANATVSRSLAAASQSTDFDDTLEKVFIEIVASANASVGHLLSYDAQANTLATIAWKDENGNGRGVHVDAPPLLRSAFDADVTPAFRRCLESKEIFTINLTNHSPELAALMWPGTKEWHLARGRESVCAIPVLVGQRPVGMIGLAWKNQLSFSADQRELLFALTNQAAMVMQLRELADSQRTAMMLQERARFAGQIHDTLAQGFTGTLLHLEALRVRVARGQRVTVEELQGIRKIAALGLAEARRSALAIRPLALDGRDLATALQQLTERSNVPGLLDCHWSLGGHPRPLSAIVDESILNIAHEAVSNAIRHADASEIRISLTFDLEVVTLSVRDDGIGFDASDSRQRGHTFGLRSMRDRAAALGGELSVHSRHGEGTMVTLRFSTK
jgi:signal transduction histidine kinase